MNNSIAIIIPTYKRVDFLKRAINSVYNTSIDEIVVINDNSVSDNYNIVVDELISKDYPKVIYLKHGINKGVSVAKNTGIKVCQSSWIMCLDDDDYYFIDCFNNLKKFLKQNSDFDVVHFKIKTLINGNFSIWGEESFTLEQIKQNNLIPNGSLFKKEVWTKLDGFKSIPYEDWDFWIRAKKEGFKFIFYPEIFSLRERRYDETSLLFRDLQKLSFEEWKKKYV